MPQTRDQIQLSYGRLTDWGNINPLLLPGEIACVFSDEDFTPVDLRIGNGVSRFLDLPSFLTTTIAYTKEQINDLLSALSERITANATDIEGIKTVTIPALQSSVESLQSLVDDSASSDNKLTALSTVIDSITQALETRFGRIITATAGGLRFGAVAPLQAGPWYYNSIRLTKDQLVLGDQAYITNLAYPYYFDGNTWQPQSIVFTTQQNAALSSGVTSDTVRAVAQNVTDVNNLRTSLTAKADKYAVYKHAVKSVTYSNTVYYKNTLAYLFDGGSEVGRAIITDDCSISNPLSTDKLYIFDTAVSLPTTPLALKAESDSSTAVYSYVVVDNTSVSRNLSDTAAYLGDEAGRLANTRLDRGLADSKYRIVKNRKLEEIYTAETIRYVDGNYTGTEQGIEIAPFTTIAAALNSRSRDVAIVVAPYAQGYTNNNGRLSLLGRTNTDIVGYAVGSQTPTMLNVPVVVGADNTNATNGIGLRDLRIPSLTLQSGSDYYLENVTIQDSSVGSLIVDIKLSSSTAKVVFSHCTFKGKLLVSGGDVQFDSCDFAIGSLLDISSSAKVVVRDCAGLSVSVKGTAIYIQESAILVPGSSSAYSFSATATGSAQPFVGLFSGVSLDSLGTSSATPEYAPISIGSGVTYALGSFIYKKEGSVISGTRLVSDGLDSTQIYAGSKTLANDGYAATGYLDAHLAGIGDRLKQIAEEAGTLSSGVTNVQAGTSSTRGQIRLVVTKQIDKTHTENINVDAVVKDLGTAAYKNESYFAVKTEVSNKFTSVEGSVASLQGAVSDLTTAVAGKQTANLVTSIDSASTNVQYPSAKAVYDKLKNLSDRISSLSQGGRILLPTSDGSSTSFGTLSDLNSNISTANYFYADGAETSPGLGDRALYDTGTKIALFTSTNTGGATLNQWIFFYSVVTDLAPYEEVLGSGVTASWKAGVDGTIEDLVSSNAKAQGEISRTSAVNNYLLTTSAATSGALGQSVGTRAVITDVSGAADAAIPTVSALKSYLTAQLASKQDSLVAGNNISISGNEISATYTAGDNISISDGTISATYKAGSNVQIAADGTISATNTTYDQASNAALGLIKVGYTENNKNYAVQLDIDGKAYVNVPWTSEGGGGGSGNYFPLNSSSYNPGASYLIGSSTTGFANLKYREVAEISTASGQNPDNSAVPTVAKIEDEYIQKTAFTFPQSEEILAANEFVPVYTGDGLSFIKKKYTANSSQDVKKIEGDSDSNLSLASYAYYSYTGAAGGTSYIKLSGSSYTTSHSYTSVFLGLDEHGGAITDNPFSRITVYFSLPNEGMELALDNSLAAFKWTGTTNDTKLSLTNSTVFMWFPQSSQNVNQTYTLFNSQFYLHFDTANTTTGAPYIPVIKGSDSVIYLSGNVKDVNFTDLANSIIYVGTGCTVRADTIGSSNRVVYLSTSETVSNIKNNAFLTIARNSATSTDGSVADGKFVANLSVPYAATATTLENSPTITGGTAQYNSTITVTAGGQTSSPVTLPYADTANRLVSNVTGTYGTNAKTGISIGSSTYPVYFSDGLPSKASQYAGGTKVTLNGTDNPDSDQGDRGAKTASFYAPTSEGSSGNYLESAGSNISPSWKVKASTITSDTPNVPTTAAVYNALPTVNGVATKPTSGPSIFAPTSPGASGQLLVSDGIGAPSWKGYLRKGSTSSRTTLNNNNSNSYAESFLSISATKNLTLSGNFTNCDIVVTGGYTVTLTGLVTGCTITLEATSSTKYPKLQLGTNGMIQSSRIFGDNVSGVYISNSLLIGDNNGEQLFSGNLVTNFYISSTAANNRPTVGSKAMTFGNWNGSVIF